MASASVTWTSGKQLVAESSSGHAIVLDAPEEVGGRNTGATPMELLLASLAGCTSIDVLFILGDRMKKPITTLSVHGTGERAAEPPKVYTKIDVRYAVSGPGLRKKDALRAIRLSAETFCSVSVMLGKTAKITHHYEITDTSSGETHSGALADDEG